MIESYELAFRMQGELPRMLDLSNETKETMALYGVDQGPTDVFGRQCLLARRFVEAGVRFVEVTHTDWDHHGFLNTLMPNMCRQIERPIAGLLADLERRGLLDDTLVVWGGEFGRTPDDATTDGRGHNNKGYSMWPAGGGVRAGHVHGATDEHGYEAVEGKVHLHDLHATILHLLGLDHERLTYRHGGREFRLTDVHGRVVREILS
jgi:membrane-anchored protein YejM (alkaline phosphatase superfamily)